MSVRLQERPVSIDAEPCQEEVLSTEPHQVDTSKQKFVAALWICISIALLTMSLGGLGIGVMTMLMSLAIEPAITNACFVVLPIALIGLLIAFRLERDVLRAIRQDKTRS